MFGAIRRKKKTFPVRIESICYYFRVYSPPETPAWRSQGSLSLSSNSRGVFLVKLAKFAIWGNLNYQISSFDLLLNHVLRNPASDISM